MPASPAIDGSGQTYYRLVTGAGTEQDPYASVVSVVSSNSVGLIPKLATDVSITTTFTNILTLDVKNSALVSLTLKNTGANPLTDFRISGTRGNSYVESSILASSDADFTIMLGVVTSNPHARIVESTKNPRSLAGNSITSLVVNVKDLYTLTLAATSAGTTANYEGLALLL